MTITASERVVLAKLLPHLTWRHHGIGCLQAYVRENVEPEVRVHLWHPSLVRPGIRGCGDVHDHRFDLESRVLHGKLAETRWSPPDAYDLLTREQPESVDIWEVQNARAAGAAAGFDGMCVQAYVGVQMHERAVQHYSPDAVYQYWLPRGMFHRTVAEGLAITVCTMHEKRGQAHILVPAGKEPVHAFGAPADAEVQSVVLAEAIEALS